MRVIGPEPDEDRELREWFDDQAKHNLDRLEAGAKTIIQLITGLYGLFFAVLALGDQPAYLQHLAVRIAGTVSMAAFFIALLSAVWVVLPRRSSYHQDNLTAMKQVHRQLLGRKSFWLRITLILFIIGAAALATMIIFVLWGL